MGERFEKVAGRTGGKKETLAERLKQHPELARRFEMILDIVDNAAGDVEKADEAERRAIEAVRQLGNEVLQDWAQRQHQKKEQQYDAKAEVNRKEKNALLVHGLRKDRNRRADISVWSKRSRGTPSSRVRRGAVPGIFALVATSDGGFWGRRSVCWGGQKAEGALRH